MDIYIVDDHALLRDSLRSLCQTRGHRVLGEAANAAHAIDTLRHLAPDVVLLDLQLGRAPEPALQPASGLVVLKAMQTMGHGARVLVLTMWGAPRHVNQALQAGATGYALKGVSADELELALQTVYAGQRYLSPELAGVAGLQAAPAEGAATMPTEAAALQSLSARELQILMLVVQGSSSSSIGLQLGLSPKTIESYRSRLMDKLALADVTALVRWAVRNGLLSAN